VPVRIAEMRWWHVADAHRLEQQLFADPWSVETFWSELAGVPESRHYVVALEGERVVGYAGLFATRHEADVQTVAVAPDRQGDGLGARLLETLLDEAGRRGCGEVLLEVRADNAAALRLYAAHGFARIAVRRGYYPPDGTDAIVMRRRGSGPAVGGPADVS
jgi:[ribosomal protein S18]-alanine N-acetyltransferase